MKPLDIVEDRSVAQRIADGDFPFQDEDEERAYRWICDADQRRNQLKPVASFDADLLALRKLIADVRADERAKTLSEGLALRG